MRNAFSILILCFALAAPLGLSAQNAEVESQAAGLQEQGPALQAFMQRSRQGQVDPAFASEVLRGAKALEDQGLPAEPYLLKANEGLAKRVAPPKILPALGETGTRIRSAAELIDGTVARGASATPESRRQAILQLQSALMSGRPRGELEKALRSGLTKDSKPSLSELTADATGLGKSSKAKAPKAPDQPHLKDSLDSTKPTKSLGPDKVKPEKKQPSLEKKKEKQGASFQKPAQPKLRPQSGSDGNSKGKGGGKGKAK